MRAVLTIAMAALTVLYPLAVYYGLTRLGTRSVAVVLAVLLGLSALLKWKSLFQQPRELLGIMLAGSALALSALFNDHRFLLATPVLINAGLFLTFAGSLRTATPLVERFARMQVSDLSEEELRYCRTVTQVWSAFFVLNGGTAFGLALLAPLSWWALYNGLLAYLLIGLLGASEYVIRKRRFGRFGDNPLDRALRAVLAPSARRGTNG
jgi:uncharacterized membrane protein